MAMTGIYLSMPRCLSIWETRTSSWSRLSISPCCFFEIGDVFGDRSEATLDGREDNGERCLALLVLVRLLCGRRVFAIH
jgi:hypothetical protein